MLKKIASYEVYLTIIWLLCILLVNPIGDFPLNDDWSYARNVKSLVLENKIFFDDWGAMTLIAHTLWGAFFCKIFGFSFTVLRCSTLFLGWLGLIATQAFFKEGGMSKKQAFWATLLVAFNPFYFTNAFSYMTEVPFLCFLMLAALFALKNINTQRNIYIIYLTIFSIIATLIRQPGVLIPIAFFFTYLLKNKFSFSNLIKATAPVFITFLSLSSFTYWRNTYYSLSVHFGKTEQLLDNIYNGSFARAIEVRAHGFFALWGLFLIPLLIILIPYFWKKTTWIVKFFVVGIALIMSYPYLQILDNIYLGNTFDNFGMGPMVLPSESKISPPKIHWKDWNNVFMVGFAFGIFLLQFILLRTFQIFNLIKNKTSPSVNWGSVFSLIAAFGYFAFLMLNNFYFDRYNLIAVPFLILLIAPLPEFLNPPKVFRWIGTLGFIIIMLFSIGATHDYLSWNRARWEALDFSEKDLQLQPEQINGGFEFKKMNKIESGRTTGWQYFEEWDSHPEQYILAHSKICKYNVIKTFPHRRLMPPRMDSIFILQKGKLTNFDSLTCGAEVITEDGKHFITNQEGILLQNTETQVSDRSHSGKHSILIHRGSEYSFTFTMKDVVPCEKISVTSWKYPPYNAIKAVMIIDGNEYIHNIDYVTAYEEHTGWGKCAQEFTIPTHINNNEVSFFLYNPSHEKVWFDDLTIVRMK